MIGKLTMDPGEDTPDYIYGIEIRLDGGITYTENDHYRRVERARERLKTVADMNKNLSYDHRSDDFFHQEWFTLTPDGKRTKHWYVGTVKRFSLW
jgi:hypothetical protein